MNYAFRRCLDQPTCNRKVKNDKWLINCSYNLQKDTLGTYLEKLNKSIDLLSSDYEKMILYLVILILELTIVTKNTFLEIIA